MRDFLSLHLRKNKQSHFFGEQRGHDCQITKVRQVTIRMNICGVIWKFIFWYIIFSKTIQEVKNQQNSQQRTQLKTYIQKIILPFHTNQQKHLLFSFPHPSLNPSILSSSSSFATWTLLYPISPCPNVHSSTSLTTSLIPHSRNIPQSYEFSCWGYSYTTSRVCSFQQNQSAKSLMFWKIALEVSDCQQCWMGLLMLSNMLILPLLMSAKYQCAPPLIATTILLNLVILFLFSARVIISGDLEKVVCAKNEFSTLYSLPISNALVSIIYRYELIISSLSQRPKLRVLNERAVSFQRIFRVIFFMSRLGVLLADIQRVRMLVQQLYEMSGQSFNQPEYFSSLIATISWSYILPNTPLSSVSCLSSPSSLIRSSMSLPSSSLLQFLYTLFQKCFFRLRSTYQRYLNWVQVWCRCSRCWAERTWDSIIWWRRWGEERGQGEVGSMSMSEAQVGIVQVEGLIVGCLSQWATDGWLMGCQSVSIWLWVLFSTLLTSISVLQITALTPLTCPSSSALPLFLTISSVLSLSAYRLTVTGLLFLLSQSLFLIYSKILVIIAFIQINIIAS